MSDHRCSKKGKGQSTSESKDTSDVPPNESPKQGESSSVPPVKPPRRVKRINSLSSDSSVTVGSTVSDTLSSLSTESTLNESLEQSLEEEQKKETEASPSKLLRGLRKKVTSKKRRGFKPKQHSSLPTVSECTATKTKVKATLSWPMTSPKSPTGQSGAAAESGSSSSWVVDELSLISSGPSRWSTSTSLDIEDDMISPQLRPSVSGVQPKTSTLETSYVPATEELTEENAEESTTSSSEEWSTVKCVSVLSASPTLAVEGLSDLEEVDEIEQDEESAAAKLKHTEGAVKLTVCTPNLKDKKEDAPLAEETGSATTSVPAGSAASRSASGNQTPDPGLAAAGSSRPHSPRPAPSPVRTEPPADPATAPIQPNQDTIIEITTESQNLGLFLLGGSDTSINGPAAVVLDVIQDRPVGRDGRLQRGDQIRAACGIQLTEAMTEDRLNMTIKQWAPKLKFTVFRPDPIQYEDIEVDVNRKQKPLGFGFAAFSNDRGIYITQILPGSPAEQDGRLRRGDHILTVDGKDVSSAEFTAASVALKLIGPKVSIKIRRLKIVR